MVNFSMFKRIKICLCFCPFLSMFLNHILVILSIFSHFRIEIFLLKKGVPSQNLNFSKKCWKKGSKLNIGGQKLSQRKNNWEIFFRFFQNSDFFKQLQLSFSIYTYEVSVVPPKIITSVPNVIVRKFILFSLSWR